MLPVLRCFGLLFIEYLSSNATIGEGFLNFIGYNIRDSSNYLGRNVTLRPGIPLPHISTSVDGAVCKNLAAYGGEVISHLL